jgi:hypothetical protein
METASTKEPLVTEVNNDMIGEFKSNENSTQITVKKSPIQRYVI